jgi:hypothetical protein
VKLNKREKTFVIGGVIISGIILIYNFMIEPFILNQREIRNNILKKELIIDKYKDIISEKDKWEIELRNKEELLKNIERGLLKGDKPSVVAAELQKILKDIASKLNMDFQNERIMEPKDIDGYMKIPVQINLRSDIKKIKDFIYRIENSDNILRISQMKLRVINQINPSEIQANFIIEGIIRKKEK